MSNDASFRPDDDPRGLLAAIVNSSDDAIFATDVTGTILTWNRGAERMYGYSAAEMVGRSFTILAPDETAAAEMKLGRQRVAVGERIEGKEVVRRTKGGRLVHVAINVAPIVDASGRVVAASTIAHDISDRKRVERALRSSEAHWRAIIDSAVDGIIVIDGRGTIESFNPAAERLFGYRPSEVLGRNVKMLMPEPYRAEHDGYLARYLATREAKIIGIGREVTAMRKDGTLFPVHLAVAEMSIEGTPKFTGIVHDLTERVRIETQLREQSALTKLGQMAAVVAHEVKNPLTGIRGAIQVIGGRLPAGGKDAAVVKEIIARIDALNDLMKDLLLFARPPQPKLAPVALFSLVKTVGDLVRQDPALKDFHIEVAGDTPVVAGDADMLKIVVQNLVLNSAQATQGKGTVRASLSATAAGCELTLVDDGPGIPDEVRERLFTPFFTTKARGTGLGLSTAKRLIEAQGGTIAVECPPSGGTIVRLRFPVESI